MQSIIYKTNKVKILLIFLGAIVITAIGMVGVMYSPLILDYYIGILPLILIGLTYLIVGLGILCILIALFRLFNRKFDLQVSAEGFKNNANFSRTGMIKWTDVESIAIVKQSMHQGIAVFLKDPESFLSQFTGLKRQGLELTKHSYDTPCYLDVSALKADVDEIAAKMNEFLDQVHPGDQ
jgi:hypothetical protein